MINEITTICFEDIKEDIVNFFRRKSLIPIIGSGLSVGVTTPTGTVPSGSVFKEYMLNKLELTHKFSEDEMKGIQSETFSSICSIYEDDEYITSSDRIDYLKNNFYNAKYNASDIRLSFFDINWPYIYSLNIDDVIENSTKYRKIVLPNREIREDIFNENKCLIKLHGDISEIVTYTDGVKIFSTKEYALSIGENTSLLNKLRNDYSYQNLVFIGCSLDDEIDLLTISHLPVSMTSGDPYRRTMLFTTNTPNLVQKTKIKQIGITDVVLFSNYDEIYKSLQDAWQESQKISSNDLNKFENLSCEFLKSNDSKQNDAYFFLGEGIVNYQESKITYPYYFVFRTITNEIINNISNNKIHLVRGNRVSGKSYLLAGLYRKIKDRRVFLFDGTSRISNEALSELLKIQKCVILFDVGALTREQVEIVLENSSKLNESENNIVLCANNSDSEINGLIKYKQEKGLINEHDIIKYALTNHIKNETANHKELNQKLIALKLLPYKSTHSFLDQIIYAEKKLRQKSKYIEKNICIENHKQLALLIYLAIKEKIYTLDVINYSFETEIIEALEKYSPFIERVETFVSEKDERDLSSVKYILNSKYWLRRELGKFASKKSNNDLIARAYRYIIEKINQNSKQNEFRKRKLSKPFIMFDVINDIFINEYGGAINIIKNIYDELYDVMSTDHNFLHQNAKCLMNYSFAFKGTESNSIEKIVLQARKLSIIAREIVENSYQETGNDRLLITIAHIKFTLAFIQSNLCKLEEYADIDEIEKTIDIVIEAQDSPYNVDYENGQRSSKSINDFIDEIYDKKNKNIIDFDDSFKKKIDYIKSKKTFGISASKKSF